MNLVILKKNKQGFIVNVTEFGDLLIPFLVWEKYGLYNNIETDESLFNKIKYEAEFTEAKNYAYRLLSKRSYFENELRKKLLMKKKSEAIVKDVIAELKALGFINDEKYAAEFVEYKINIRKFGLNRISNELLRKGVERNLINNVLSRFADDDVLSQNIHLTAIKKLKSLIKKEDDRRKIFQKIFSHLVLKGYSTELIMEELKQLKLNNYEEI
jgi:regulatory protein